MTTLQSASPPIQTLADLLDHLGGVSAARVRFFPAPGTATEEDVLETERRDDRLCELVDGVLVEKAMGFREACLAGALLAILRDFVMPRKLGLVAGADGTLRLFPGLVRIPDVAFVSWSRVPGGRMPVDPLPSLVPELVVEVSSTGNTTAEMARKRSEYFAAGVMVVWLIEPSARVVSVYTSSEQRTQFTEAEEIAVGPFIPGLTISLRSLFAELDL